MAASLEMFDALRRETRGLTLGSAFRINHLDKLDLSKLRTSDLVSRGFSEAAAERVSGDLLSGGLQELGKAIGLVIEVDRTALNLIPGEGIRRAAEYLREDPETLEEMLQQMDQIRHPERYVP